MAQNYTAEQRAEILRSREMLETEMGVHFRDINPNDEPPQRRTTGLGPHVADEVSDDINPPSYG